ncbi:MAG: HlyC/CorC family transporter [Bacteroidales bacterium]|nr:HlyC/CorC family transporter [Bacteroidales bacterium]MBK9356013.1 HlyC/CorC family transporter [Bacteroidales bacterium]
MDLLIPILISLLFSAFFSGMEIAFVSSNKLKIEVDKNKDLLPARILSGFARRQSRFIGAMLLGNNIALVIYGIYSARLLYDPLLRIIPQGIGSAVILLILQTLLSTMVILVVAEFLPKMLFRINPNKIIEFFAIPTYIIYVLIYPAIILFIGLSELILHYIFRINITQPDYSFSAVDLDHYLKESAILQPAEHEDFQEIQMFQNVRDLGNIKLRECMVPRNEIAAINSNESIESLNSLFIESGHSKIPVYHDSIDNIIGYAHLFDLFGKPEKISEIIKPVMIVPETMPANKLLNMFISERKSVALVVDEFGGTAGMLTIEDIIEEIFGEIDDEFDVEDLIENQLDNDEYLFSGRLEIDYLNQKYGLKLAETDDYETLAGYIIHHHESIPGINEEIIIDNFLFTIVQATDTKIEQVLLRLNPT